MKAKKPVILSKVVLISTFLVLINLINTASQDPSRKELDSINFIIRKCVTDSCKFYIMHSLFWKYRFAYNPVSKYFGELAFNFIKYTNNPRLQADGYDIKVNLLNDEMKYDSSLLLLQKALELSRKIDYKNRIMWCYYGIGQIYSIKNTPEKAIYFYKQAREYSIQLEITDQTSWLNTCVASTYNILGKKDSALIFFNKNLELFKKHKNKDREVYNYLDLYYFYIEKNNFKKAFESMYLSLNKAEKLNKPEPLFYVYMNVGLLFFNKENDSLALIYYNKALPLAEKLKRKDLIAELNTLYCKYYVRNGQFSKALLHLNKCLKLSNDISDKCVLSEIYYLLGVNYERLGNYKLSLENFKLCYTLGNNNCDKVFFHRILLAIGDINLRNNNIGEAFRWYNKSLELADSTKSNENISLSKMRLGNYYKILNQSKLAESNYIESYKYTRESGNISIIKDIADTLSNFYSSQKNFQVANLYLKISEKMNDSIHTSEQISGISKLEMMLEIEGNRKISEIKILKTSEEIKRQKLQRNYFAVFSVLLCVVIILIIRSNSRKKKDNILLHNRNQQIVQQKKELEEISKKLHEADELKLRFFTNISHELRTPLTLIISPVLKLFKESDNSNKEIYSLILRNSRRLQELINQLLDISKFDKGELKLNLKPHNLSRQINVIAGMFQSLVEEKKINFRVISTLKKIFCTYDSDRMEHVFNNLLSNAVKFTREGGTVTLKISVIENLQENIRISNIADKFVEIKLKDNGIGIPKSSISRIFDRFYQSELTINNNYGGSGIGLSLTKEIIELHGGSISVQSVQNKWTEFSVLLPVNITENSDIIELDEFEDSYHLNKKNGDSLTKKNSSETILLVEDNKDFILYLRDSLSESFSVIIARNGQEGLETALETIPDIVVSDIMMPKLNGYELLSSLKKHIETSHIPVLLLTAKAERESRIEGYESGAYDYINKPFDVEELILKIKNIALHKRKLQEKYRKQITVNPSQTEPKSLDEQFLINLTLIIENEISNTELNGEYISRKIGLSRPQVYRKLMALTDMSINHFIRSIRLKRAAEILQKKSATVSETAYMTGFESLSYFTKKFKEEFGKLPSEF